MNRTGRYAPSPTGALHLGNLRTALLAWLFARSQGAEFLLRIEDLDPERSRPSHQRQQLRDLAKLGLDWDGEVICQSERFERYRRQLEQLDTYECWCTRKEVQDAVTAPHTPAGTYPGTCRVLTAAQRSERLRSGRPPALRVRASSATVSFTDRLCGDVTGMVDDFVVRRNDGVYAYNLAVVVDDIDQGVGEIVRGSDLLDSTARQIWLSRQLGSHAMSYAHVPLVLGPTGARMAKRDGAVTLADREALGESAADVRALLATSVGLCEPEERLEPAELVRRFDVATFAPPASGSLPMSLANDPQ
ncbi:MAG TPA: tRNA glutamyl-Q(34) synthetase GluQRS [Baekduia sp.]|nr:tRNA glutamyl-Q(34) synthetase GluQRS [Baekduia sp.]